jgi:hypothetical protein
MIGYLQRLAVSVARSRPSLHPLVGSIFSGGRQEVAATALMESDALAPTGVQTLVSTIGTVSDSPDDPMRRRDLAADDRFEQHAGTVLPRDNRRTGHRRGAREIFHPLLPPITGELGAPAMLPETVSEDAANAQSASIGLQNDRRGTSFVGAARMAHVAVKDGPTADRRNATTTPPLSGLRERTGILAVLAGDAGKPARAEFSAPSRRSAQSDDIQIHIGRIEVTAVAQPASRPAAAPVRKAMSLDEYLGRRSRGAAR